MSSTGADKFLRGQLRPELPERACAEAGIVLEPKMQPGCDIGYDFMSTFMADHLHGQAQRLRA